MDVMATVLRWAVASSLRASVLAALVLLLSVVGRRWLRPGWMYALWLLVLVQFALPRIPTGSLSIYARLPTAVRAVLTIPAAAGLPPSRSAPRVPAVGLSVASPSTTTAVSPSASRTRARAGRGRPAPWVDLLVRVWLAGVAFWAGRIWTAEHGFRKRLRHAVPLTSPRALAVWHSLVAASHRGRAPRLRTMEGLRSPVLFGVFTPLALFPIGLAEQLTERELRHILLHELVHHRRRDLVVNWLATGLQVLHWFNPLVWWICQRMAAAQEMACDEATVSHPAGGPPGDYGRTLVRVLELTRVQDPRLPSVAGMMRAGSFHRQRIVMLTRLDQPAAPWSAPAGCAVALACTAALTVGAVAPAPTLASAGGGPTSTNCTLPAVASVTPAASALSWTPSVDDLGTGHPFALTLGDTVGGQEGAPVPLQVRISPSSGAPAGVVLAAPLQLRVCIYAAVEQGGSGPHWTQHGAPLWSFTPPPLTTAQSARGQKISFSWNGRTTTGQPVPPGVYLAELAFPLAVQYRANGQTATEILPSGPQYFRAPIVLPVELS